jgi:prepilin-type N-terminal cleavage/methylation domain-containing protein
VTKQQYNAFTLIELLVVIALIAALLALLTPALRRAQLSARIVAVNSDLRQIGIALHCYHTDNNKFPPTREDCNSGALKEHLYQLPKELTAGNYLPGKGRLDAMSTAIEDRFNPGHSYKYRSIGECIRDRDIIDRWTKARLWVPTGFPAMESPDDGQWYNTPRESPVQWTVFSVGPQFDEESPQFAENKYPVPRQMWFSPEQKKGLLVRLRLKNGNEIGSFEGNKGS